MGNYRIIQDVKWDCRLINVVNKPNFIVLKLGKYDTGELLFSIIRNSNSNSYQQFCSDMAQRNKHTIHRVCIESNIGVYHKYTWTDVDKNICGRSHVGEVQRDSNGNPIVWKRVIVFANLDELGEPFAGNIFYKEYVEINSAFADSALKYNNQQSFNEKCRTAQEQKDRMLEASYNQMLDAVYEAREHNYDDLDLTDEDIVMSALENGNGENFGF